MDAVRQQSSPFLRKIFGDLPLLQREKDAERNLVQYLNAKRFPLQGTIFDDTTGRLRFLQSNDWDLERCRQDMERHLEWRRTNLPVSYDLVANQLPKGYCYVHGRDRCMRPIVIIRCRQLNDASRGDGLRLIVYWLELVINQLLVRSRVEQWRVIVDLADCAIYNVPAMVLKDIFTTLAHNYRGRLHQMTIVNAPLVFWGIWQIASVALSETTRQKISIWSTGFENELLAHVDSSQLERKYGGSQEDCPINETMPVMPLLPKDVSESSDTLPLDGSRYV